MLRCLQRHTMRRYLLIILVILLGLSYNARGSEDVATEFIPVQDMQTVEGGDVGDLRKLINTHAERLGISKDKAYNNALDFADIVGLVESNGDPRARNKESTASGTYQFVQGSVEPAIKRLEKYIGMKPWMKSAVVHKDASRLTPSQQTLLFLGDILEKEGSDEYLKSILDSGDLKAMEGAYMKLHHTAPDMETIKNWNKKVYDGGVSK